MASGILLGVVVSVTAAITAGQQHSYEAQQRIAGTLAAEELIGRIVSVEYTTLPSWDGHIENVGSMVDMNGQPMPDIFGAVGREVQVTTTVRELKDLGVKIEGRDVQVRAFDSTDRTLAELTTFVPKPAESS